MFTLRAFMLTLCVILILNLIMLFSFYKRKYKNKLLLETDSILEEQVICLSENAELNGYRYKDIVEKLDVILKNDKLYTKCDLSLNDIAEVLGTNRTYVSAGINSFYKQNFSSYLNNFRWDELISLVEEDVSMSVKELASRCGFGSLDSLNRTAKVKTGLTFKEWKNLYISSDAF